MSINLFEIAQATPEQQRRMVLQWMREGRPVAVFQENGKTCYLLPDNMNYARVDFADHGPIADMRGEKMPPFVNYRDIQTELTQL